MRCDVKTGRIPRLRFGFVWGLLLVSSIASAATRVDLVIDEPFADRSAVWPVTTGVPFPRGGLTKAENCRLVDDQGRERPLQAKIAATWDAEAKSIRWLTIDFIAAPGRKYALEFGDDVRRQAFPSPLTVAQDPSVRVATGALAIDFSASGPASIGSITADLNRNGQIEPDEVVAAGSQTGEHYYVDQTGQRFTSAADGKDRQVVVEATGPVRACVRVDGFYTGPKGERIAKYRTRYHFFAGLPLVKVVDELGFVGSTKTTRFRDIGFTLDLRQTTAGRTVTVDASGDPGNQPLAAKWQADTQSVGSFQSTYRHYGNPEAHAAVSVTSPQGARVLGEGDKMGEWMQVADGRSAVTGSLRWFWQQFPKEWEATPSQLTLHLWSPRAGELDFGQAGIERFFGPWGEKYLRGGQELHNRNPLERFFYHADLATIERGDADGLGMNKHHEFFLHFGPADRAAEGAEFARLAALQPLGLATGKWNCGTDVFGPLAARPNDSPHEAAVDKIFDLGRQMQDEFGDYGWWLFGAGPHYSYQWDPQTQKHFADSRRFEHHTYSKETQLWWNYVRSGERKFYDWAIPSENHWVDVAVCHVPTKIECGWKGGEPEERTLDWRPGDWAIDSPTHYVRHHDNAEAWLRGGAQFWGSYHRTLETTTLAYYITGDERFRDVLEYWRQYWGELAGKTSASPDIRPWHQQQAWYKPTQPGEPAKTWAEMIRDYAPFGSGTRHNLTLFFNLATLYENTWDPQIGLALREYADAFLDPAHRIGTWRPQDASLPAHAEAPSMGHFWVPAMWKYARVTGDPRMPDIFRRYFAAGYAADPFREYEDVGVYSNSYVAYAYYFTRDPRFLALAAKELNQLQRYAEPLASQADMNERLYNPYAPAKTFAGVPRLIWALDAGRRDGAKVAPRPLRAQRTAIALTKLAGQPLAVTWWGYDRELTVLGPDGKPVPATYFQTEKNVSDVQPFDRTTPDFEVFLHKLTIPATAAEGFYVAAPKLELALLDWQPVNRPLWNAAAPMELKAGESIYWQVPTGATSLKLESASPTGLLAWDSQGRQLTAKVTGSVAEFDLAGVTGTVRIENRGRYLWLRMAGRPADECWTAQHDKVLPGPVPGSAPSLAAVPPPVQIEPGKAFIAGRFGSGVQIAEGRTLHIPDHVVVGGAKVPLCDARQGTLEFWVKKLWDDRLAINPKLPLLTNGLVVAATPAKLPLGEWTHVAVVWAPYRGDPERTLTYTYVNGRDLAFYRSLNWDGYSSPRPQAGGKAVQLLEEFLAKAAPGTAFALDEVRVSKTARYADLSVAFGPQKTFNPFAFDPPTAPFKPDGDTVLLLHLDGDATAAIPQSPPLAGTIVEGKRP